MPLLEHLHYKTIYNVLIYLVNFDQNHNKQFDHIDQD